VRAHHTCALIGCVLRTAKHIALRSSCRPCWPPVLAARVGLALVKRDGCRCLERPLVGILDHRPKAELFQNSPDQGDIVVWVPKWSDVLVAVRPVANQTRVSGPLVAVPQRKARCHEEPNHGKWAQPVRCNNVLPPPTTSARNLDGDRS